MPLVAVSEVTKNKLQKFQFDSRAPEFDPKPHTAKLPAVPEGATVTTIDDDSDKENATSSRPQKPSPADLLPVLNATTPVARLAWQDLMGSGDPSRDDEETSPSERLLWHNERDNLSSVISPMLARQGKKRARSSSPTSSPANAKPHTPTVNVKGLQQALKSPHADPALELWDRFSLSGKSNDTPLGVTNPALAHLMMSSSPRPAKDGAAAVYTEASLRRAISCGTHWPKRRRIEKSNAVSPTSRLGAGEGPHSKTSMVSALLETVTGEINKSQASLESPESCAKGLAEQDQDICTPTAKRTGPGKVEVGAKNRMEQERLQAVSEEEHASDYGDDDFDDDTLMELDASLNPAQSNEVVAETVPEIAQNAEQSKPPLAPADLHDEFGDDDDLFAAAEDLLAGIDSKVPSQGGCPSHQALGVSARDGKETERLEEAEDSYGNDFGDFDFEAAEAAAVQSVKSTSAPISLSNVRTK